jgi:uncharacterized protein (DUF4415 family)
MKKKQAARPVNENPSWTEGDFKDAKPFSKLPKSLQEKLSTRTRGPQKASTKIAVSIRLSADVVEDLRASGAGWQSRADGALREWLAKTKKRAS